MLGDHVAQKGSLVSPDRLRFDIAHPKPITDEELAAVEDIANRVVLENAPVVTRLMGLDEARASGARALFDEKYGDEVRVVSMGTIEGGDNGPRPYSVELCGGTHVARTGDIGLVSIVGESAVAAGVRRIEAKTRDAARRRLNEEARALADLAALLRAPVGEVGGRLEALIDERKKLERELADARRKLAMGGGSGGGDGPARGRGRQVLRAPGFRRRDEGPEVARRRSQAEPRLGRRRRSSPPPRTARRAWSSASPAISPSASTPSISCAAARRRSAARAAAAAPTWPRPAARKAPRRPRRSPPSKPRCATRRLEGGGHRLPEPRSPSSPLRLLASEAPLSRSLARGLTAARVSGVFVSKVLLRHPARWAGIEQQRLVETNTPHRCGAVTAKRP